VFGIGASVMVAGIGVLLDPASALPQWLSIVLVLLLTIVMWVVLRPFRRLTQMVSPGHGFFADGAGAVTGSGRKVTGLGKKVLTMAVSSFIGNTAAHAVGNKDTETSEAATTEHPRAEATSLPPVPPQLAAPEAVRPAITGASERASTEHPPGPDASGPAPARTVPADPSRTIPYEAHGDGVWRPATSEGGRVPDAVEPEEIDGEQVYVLYSPGEDADDEADSRV
jgi:hypothetical protein